MIDIYNEVGHIASVLEKGFNRNKWKQDLALLVKFRKSQIPRPKKSEVKKEMLEKCIAYVPGFDRITDRHAIDQLVEKTWNSWKIDLKNPDKSDKLRDITEIELTQEILDWFLNLENTTIISDEEKEKFQKKRKGKIKNNPINFNRTKILFTLFVWSKIQQNYVNKYWFLDIQNYKKKFRKDADIGANYNINDDLDLLEDLGFIKTTHKNTVVVSFMKNLDLFSSPITEENRIILDGQDLYDCGLWLKKQKYDYFTCENCGQPVFQVKNKKNKNGRHKKYCNKCIKNFSNKATLDIKEVNLENVICECCGKNISIISKYASKHICGECKEKHKAERNHRNYLKRKEKILNSVGTTPEN